jgi:hypothetical protein
MSSTEPMRLHRRSILQRAKSAGVKGDDALKDILFHQLLARILASSPDAFVLKGAQALQIRGVTDRATADLDLVAQGDLDEALATLRNAIAVDLGDGLLYQERLAPRPLAGDDGPARGLRVALESIFDGIPHAIGVDLVSDPLSRVARDRFTRIPLVAVPGIEPLDVGVYDLAAHLADKIAATLDTYGQGRTSSRTKDLYDICAIALTSVIDGSQGVSAVRAQLRRRGIPAADGLEVPATLTSGWARFVRGSHRDTSQLPHPDVPTDVDAAVGLASSLVSPLITGEAEGSRWNPSAQRWERS